MAIYENITGTIKHINQEGFGLIHPDNTIGAHDRDVFFTQDSLMYTEWSEIKVGQRVKMFRIASSKRGLQADKVYLIDVPIPSIVTSTLIALPRVESSSPSKNTIEWEIPDSALVVFMLVQGVGYTVTLKVRVHRRHWWNRAWITRTISSNDPSDAIMRAVTVLEENGYTIDHNTVQWGEKVGNPEYFRD